ncbi:MAG: O-antigen ligase family protein [Acidobacteriota bacterium]|nr:O-antigen ligase family protein [Acidobacteriota bacterium]
MILASGLAYLFPASPLIILGAFLAGVLAITWIGGDEIGLASTAYSLIVIGVFFHAVVDATSLTLFAAIAAVACIFARVTRRTGNAADPSPILGPGVGTAVAALPFALGLPLLVVVIYTDLSNAVMTHYAMPSLLQPLIALLAFAVWWYRDRFRPSEAALHPVVILLGIYCVVLLAGTIWAVELELADARLGESVKALLICILAGSLAASWSALRRGIAALVIAATCFSVLSVIQVLTGKLTNVLGGLIHLQSGNIYSDVSLPRASGPPVADPNFYARILLVGVPLAIAFAIAERRPRWCIAYILAACAVTAGTLLTYSRGAMLTVAGMAILLLFAWPLRPRYAAFAAITAALLLAVLPSDITRRVFTLQTLLPGQEEALELDSSVEERKLLVRAGMGMFADHPIGGVGPANFEAHFNQYADRAGSAAYDYHPPGTRKFPHGLWVEIASESGLLGLTAFGSILIAAFVALWRARRELLARNDAPHAALATGLAIALAGYLGASLFLHETHLRYIGLYLGLTVAVTRLTREATA